MTRHPNVPRRLLATLTTFAAALTLGLVATAATPAAERADAATPVHGDGDVILNMFQWTWDSVAAECANVVGPAGFGYVQVSPPMEHVRGTQWWTSYQPVSYQIESKLGTRAEFANMVATCDAAGVGVIADAVVNHMAAGSGTGVAGSTYGQDSFPGTYSAPDFNDCRTNISDYTNRYEVQNCRLVSLQDLRTGSAYVRGRIADYLDDLVSLGVDGFRIDAAKHIPASDLEAIKAQMGNPNVFWVHEVIGSAGEPIQPSEYLGSGDSHEFNYARQLKSDFDGQIKNLRFIGDGKLPYNRAGCVRGQPRHRAQRRDDELQVGRQVRPGQHVPAVVAVRVAHRVLGLRVLQQRRRSARRHRDDRPRRDLRRRTVDLHAALDGDPRHGRLPQRGGGHGSHELVGRRRQPDHLRPRQPRVRGAEQHGVGRAALVPDVAPRGHVLRRRRVVELLGDTDRR